MITEGLSFTVNGNWQCLVGKHLPLIHAADPYLSAIDRPEM
jgi:hypothetical protein